MYAVLRSLLFRMSPERAHKLVLHTMALCPATVRLAVRKFQPSHALHQEMFGLSFPHPIGLAAGLDKDGIAVNALFDCGFSFVEVGTVTPAAQPGNPQPRLFRLKEDEALINRMGFNNRGVEQLKRNLLRKRRRGVVGVNLGKNKVTPNESAVNDYLVSLDAVYPVADYIVLNVSSPNTPGLRDLQSESALLPLVQSVLERRDAIFETQKQKIKAYRVPVLIKLAPDLADDAILSLTERLLEVGIDGFIATNTTVKRDHLKSVHQNEQGGLSGKPLKSRATEVIRLIYSVTQGRVPIIGCGGVMNADDAYEKLRAGANLVQIYTGFVYKGPGLIREIVEGLDMRIRQDGFESIKEVIGRDTLKP
jgi:dihydroorotate dehydrogenase